MALEILVRPHTPLSEVQSSPRAADRSPAVLKKKKVSFGRRVAHAAALTLSLAGFTLVGQEVATVAQRIVTQQEVNPTLLEQSVRRLHDNYQAAPADIDIMNLAVNQKNAARLVFWNGMGKPPSITNTTWNYDTTNNGWDLHDRTGKTLLTGLALRKKPIQNDPQVTIMSETQSQNIPMTTLWKQHQQSKNIDISYTSPLNPDTKRLYRENNGDSATILDMSQMDAYQNSPQSAYFMFQLPQYAPLLVKAHNGKLILNPLDTNPTHLVHFANGSTMQLGEFSQLVGCGTPGDKQLAEVDATRVTKTAQGALEVTQLAGIAGTEKVPLSLHIPTQGDGISYVPHPQGYYNTSFQSTQKNPVSPLPFVPVALGAEAVLLGIKKKRKKGNETQYTLQQVLQEGTRVLSTSNTSAVEIQQKMKALGLSLRISEKKFTSLPTEEQKQEYLKQVLAETYAEKKTQETVSQYAIGTLVSSFQRSRRNREKAQAVYTDTWNNEISKLVRQEKALKDTLIHVSAMYIALQFPNLQTRDAVPGLTTLNQSLDEFIHSYTTYLLDPSSDQKHIDHLYTQLLQQTAPGRYPVTFSEFHKQFLRKRAYVQTVADVYDCEKQHIVPLSPSQRKAVKQEYYREGLRLLRTMDNRRTLRREYSQQMLLPTS